MPRIAAALAVLAMIAASMGLNTARYPIVWKMSREGLTPRFLRAATPPPRAAQPVVTVSFQEETVDRLAASLAVDERPQGLPVGVQPIPVADVKPIARLTVAGPPDSANGADSSERSRPDKSSPGAASDSRGDKPEVGSVATTVRAAPSKPDADPPQANEAPPRTASTDSPSSVTADSPGDAATETTTSQFAQTPAESKGGGKRKSGKGAPRTPPAAETMESPAGEKADRVEVASAGEPETKSTETAPGNRLVPVVRAEPTDADDADGKLLERLPPVGDVAVTIPALPPGVFPFYPKTGIE